MRRPLTLSFFALVIVITQAIPGEACHRRWRNRGCCQPQCCVPIVPCRTENECWCLFEEDSVGNLKRHNCYGTLEEACAAARDELRCRTCPVYKMEWDPERQRWVLKFIRQECEGLTGDKTCKIIHEPICPIEVKKKTR